MTRSRWRWVLVGSAVAWVGVLVVAPAAAVVASALSGGPLRFLEELLRPEARSALGLSVALAAIAAVTNGVFGTATAWVLTRDRFFGRGVLNALVDVPFAVSPVILGFALLVLFGPSGWLGGALEAAGVQVVFALPGMALATVFVSLPYVVREVALVLEQLGTDQEEAAYTLGASPAVAFFTVTLPSIRFGLLSGVLLTTARALGEFGAVLVVAGGVAGLTETGTLFVFRALDDRREVAATSMAVALAALSVGLLLVMEIVKRRRAHAGS